jgi:hypothetical protein
MADDWLKGYEATDPATVKPEEEHTPHVYAPPGTMARAVRGRWRDVPVPYPFGTAKDGGRGGGG